MSKDIRTISDVANVVRGRRTGLGLGQGDLARRAGVSRKWIYEFEAGKPGAELRLVLAVVEALGLRLSVDPAPTEEPSGAADLDAFLDDYERS
jgi:HTH-type transcriptional regulator/antitoxin HipB